MRLFVHLLVIGVALVSTSVFGQLVGPNVDNSPYNKNADRVLNTNMIDDNPIRDGAFAAIKSPSGGPDDEVKGIIYDNQIIEHEEAKNETLGFIRGIVNYALGILGLVALVYLLYHGFLMLTAAGNEEQYKKGRKGLKFAIIALLGIGLSWLIVSLILYVIGYITQP